MFGFSLVLPHALYLHLFQLYNYFVFLLNKLLNIVRDNQVVIVVGETGSGKTTQLTQVPLQ